MEPENPPARARTAKPLKPDWHQSEVFVKTEASNAAAEKAGAREAIALGSRFFAVARLSDPSGSIMRSSSRVSFTISRA